MLNRPIKLAQGCLAGKAGRRFPDWRMAVAGLEAVEPSKFGNPSEAVVRDICIDAVGPGGARMSGGPTQVATGDPDDRVICGTPKVQKEIVPR